MANQKEKVAISNGTYKSFSSTIYLLRFIGIFPFELQRDVSGKLYIKRSFRYAFYSCTLGITLHCATYMGILKDLSLGYAKAVRIHSKTDGYVTLCSFTATQIVVAFGIFVIQKRYTLLFEYIKILNEVDYKLETKHTKWEGIINGIVCYGVFISMTCVVIGDYFIYAETGGKVVGYFQIIQISISYYISMVFIMVIEYQYVYLGQTLLLRLKRINELLRIFYSIGKINKQSKLKNIQVQDPAKRMEILISCYMKLIEAARYQSDLLGMTGIAAILAAFWHLISGSYYFFTELIGNRRNMPFLQTKFAWCILHYVRILLVIAPWHRCITEVENTKKWVCKLNHSSLRHSLNKQLKTFEVVLGLNPLIFSLAGFVIIRRPLFTSLLGTALTYLSILLQSNAQENQ